MKIADVLDKAADLIEPEGAWLRGWTARTRYGDLTHATDPKAACWCTAGAIIRVAEAEDDTCAETINFLEGCVGDRVTAWNDRLARTQPEVVAKLREAAAKAREQGL